jgi:hypothetical protein
MIDVINDTSSAERPVNPIRKNARMRLNSPVSAERMENPKKNRLLGRHEDNFRGRDLAAEHALRHCDHMPQYSLICAISHRQEKDAAL